MYAQFLALAVLVQLYGGGQAASLEHSQDSISYQPLQADGPANAARSDELVLKQFTWTYKKDVTTTSLTVCTLEPFADDGQTVSQVTLVTLISGAEETCEAVIADVENNCVSFTSPGCGVIIPSGDVTYTLHVNVAGLLSKDINKSGTASFTMTVGAATLKCGSKTFIRATGANGAIIDLCEAPGVDDVCYKTGDLASDPFFFTVIDSNSVELTLCLQGDNYHEQVPDGTLTITQLAYIPPDSATFSLTHETSDTTAYEAIVWKDLTPLLSCSVTPVADSSGTCSIAGFVGDHVNYEVCTILPVLETFVTALSSITDLAVQAEERASLLQFRFTNANPVKKYVAKLDNNPPGVAPPSVEIDCTGVTLNNICYGFLDTSIFEPFLTIEYRAEDSTTFNKIAIPNLGYGPDSEN